MSEQKVRIAIVGSGPAGLSAAARAKQLGISHLLLEKSDHLSDTIYKYQKGKHVMATPSQLVLRSDMDFEAGKRESVLGTWDRMAGDHEINVRHGAQGRLGIHKATEVDSLEQDDRDIHPGQRLDILGGAAQEDRVADGVIQVA